SSEVNRYRSSALVTAEDADGHAVVQIGQRGGFDVVDGKTAEVDDEVRGDRTSQLPSEGLGLPFEVVAAGEKRSHAAGLFSDLSKERSVDVVTDADAEDAGVGWLRRRSVLQRP